MRKLRDKNYSLTIPEGYHPPLGLRRTEEAIRFIKNDFQERLALELNLTRVSAPIFVTRSSGINDYLSGSEEPVRFSLAHLDEEVEIVQSLAKWKRVALANYGFSSGEGLYTDMNAVRPGEVLDNLHSIYVDQWDWERVITGRERNLDFLREVVNRIYHSIREMEKNVCDLFSEVGHSFLPPELRFIHSEELLERYPRLDPQDREREICREWGAVFITGIGAELSDGRPHDPRAADYDDWSTPTGEGRRGLNGDILVWYPPLECAFELSSMGIRVDRAALLRQLEIKGESDRKELYFHRCVLEGKLPLTIGGGIGQSRLCMMFLRKAHIGEVQAGVWPASMIEQCRENRIFLL